MATDSHSLSTCDGWHKAQIATLYRIAIHSQIIRSFRHRGLERFFHTGSKAGVQPRHAKRLRLQLARLDTASGPEDMALPAWRLHSLKGQLAGHWAVWVDASWRLTFRFVDTDAELVDYQDYH
jgi:proteic killer suppression protein